jgi:HD-GYP domain-containing protein (c-di-GMP phosphodiesterase class II)
MDDGRQRTVWELRNLQEALQAASSTLDLKHVLQQVLAGASKASSAQIGALALEESGKLVLKVAFGTDKVTAEKLALGVGGEICRSVMDSGEPFMEAMQHSTGADSPLNPRAVLCVPIKLRGKPIGVLFLANYQDGHAFNADHRKLITELAALAAVAIDRARLFKDQEEVILASLKQLGDAIDARDPWTGAHSERVTQYALMIARQMRYAPDDPAAWVRLERAGRLHDIGMIGVPDAILQKAGPLTDEEFAKMKAHTVIGFDILSGLKMLTDELVIARSHHERFDGKGYPDRKKGGELPIFAWIVSAADAIDAMTSDRLNRRGMPLEVAVDQVRAGAGTQFHPDVAEAVVDAAHNGMLKVVTTPGMAQEADVSRDHLLYELARDLSSSLELTEVLRKVMDRVIKLMNASRGFIVLVDPVNGEMSVTMAGEETDSEITNNFLGSRTVIEQVVRTGRAVVSTDASLDDRFKGQQSVIMQKLRSIIAVPMFAKGKVIGAVYVDNPFRAAIFEEKDKEFLQAIADLIAIAIDNARLSRSDQTPAPDRPN